MSSRPVASRLATKLRQKIEARTAKVGVIGMGYVGLPLALEFNQQRFPVTGFDIDAQKVATLTEGGSYIVRIAPEEIQEARGRGFTATADYSHVRQMDAVLICVPT